MRRWHGIELAVLPVTRGGALVASRERRLLETDGEQYDFRWSISWLVYLGLSQRSLWSEIGEPSHKPGHRRLWNSNSACSQFLMVGYISIFLWPRNGRDFRGFRSLRRAPSHQA